jgi:hypothetical protein
MVYCDNVGGVFMPAGKPFPGEFKPKVVEKMLTHRLSYRETARKFRILGHDTIMK